MCDVPQAQREARPSVASELTASSTCAPCGCEPGHLATSDTEPVASLDAIASGKGELAFLGHPLESFARALDPILAIVAFGRQQTDHLIGAACGRTRHIACSEIDTRSNSVLVLQRPLHTRAFPA